MELKVAEILIDKYLEGTSSIAEEKQLKAYFSSNNVAPHLVQYKPLFGYFENQKREQFTKALPLQAKKQSYVKWIGVAAAIVVLFGTINYFNNENSKQNLGTYSSPEEAFVETQKALEMLSEEVNQGVEGVAILKEYEKTKKTIFK
ncbi:hypothetical protein FIA58_018875 [Flavobacterium jejuense]|uniref:Anti sigma-E protein RseA N-terminal domain-containing protein n=1 Tax=Flavobacterium jejuense TaxID=1544455 RepID=A0ABX0IX51_9FLAO|nr:hypothetical protein [Flavobacterium jejuense]NHN27751.1 hypothetical protein [Flavobacterium jejuense]